MSSVAYTLKTTLTEISINDLLSAVAMLKHRSGCDNDLWLLVFGLRSEQTQIGVLRDPTLFSFKFPGSFGHLLAD
jgi:hypothetical protein